MQQTTQGAPSASPTGARRVPMVVCSGGCIFDQFACTPRNCIHQPFPKQRHVEGSYIFSYENGYLGS